MPVKTNVKAGHSYHNPWFDVTPGPGGGSAQSVTLYVPLLPHHLDTVFESVEGWQW